MALKIAVRSFLAKHYLIVDAGGVKYYDGTGFGSTRKFPFNRIECVLMSSDNKLSFQVGNEVFSIPIKPGNAKHQAVIDALLQEVQQTTPGIPQ